jgi:MFS family permease
VLTFAGFLLLGGRAADYFGRSHVYLTGIVVFTLASIGAGIAHNGTEMITVRAVQGIGGAILSAATLTIIVTTFRGPRLPKALNTARQVGGSLALAGLATVATDRTASLLHVVSRNAAFQISAVITLVALGMTFLVPKLTGRASAS